MQAKPHKNSKAENLNILVFGWAGSTKSSFVNSVFTLLHDSDILQPAIVGGGMDHTTKELTKYQLKHGETELNVSFWDTWGLTFQTYKGDEIRGIVNGKLPQDWKMKDLIINKQEEIRQSEESKFLREIHAILFFFPQGALTDANMEKQRKTIQATFQELIQLKYNPILVLTLVDQVCKAVRENPLGNHKEVDDLKEKTSTLLKIPPMNITYAVNYMTSDKKDFEIDRGTFKILQKAVNFAKVKTEFK